MFHLVANQCSYFSKFPGGPTFYRGGGGGGGPIAVFLYKPKELVIFQGGPDSLPRSPFPHHHTHLDQRMPMSDILIALLKASKESSES